MRRRHRRKPTPALLTHGHAGAGIGEVFTRPFQRLEFHARGANIAVGARVRLVRVQAGQCIDMKRQRFVVDADFFQGILRRGFVFGCQQQDGRPHISGFMVSNAASGSGGFFTSSAVRMPTTPGMASAAEASMCIHAGMRIRAGKEARKYHALDAEILGVLGLASDFRNHVVGQEILAKVLIRHGGFPPCCRLPA